MPSFTAQIPNLQALGPIVELTLTLHPDVEAALAERGEIAPPPISAYALIDTGASATVIQEELVAKLDLQPIGVELVTTPSSINVRCYKYLARFILPNNITWEGTVIAVPLQNQAVQCLIGRDILSRGVLVYLGQANTFTLSF